MQLLKVSIPQTAFNAIPENERRFIVSLGYLANALNILNKLLAIVIRPAPPTEPERLGAHTLMGYLARQLAGYLNEGWALLRCVYWRRGVCQTYDAQLLPEATEALSRIKRYFSRSNAIHLIRNNYAFHLPGAQTCAAAPTLRAEDSYEVFFAEASGNCLYWGAEVLAMWNLFEQVGDGDAEAGSRRVFDDVLAVSGDFVSFADGCIHAFAIRHKMAAPPVEQLEFVLRDVAAIDELRLPYFVRQGQRGKHV